MRQIKIVLLSSLIFCMGFTSESQITIPRQIAFKALNTDGTANNAPQRVASPPPHSYSPPVGMTADDIIKQTNANAMERMGYVQPAIPKNSLQPYNPLKKESSQIEEVRAILNEDMSNYRSPAAQRANKTTLYRQTFQKLMEMHKGSKPFSLKEAVFLIENAYLDNTISYDDYSRLLAEKTTLVNEWMNKENIPSNSHLGKNYIIQQLFSQQIELGSKTHKSYAYDFDDFWGEKDWSNMFVSKLLKTGTGQCHSMPLLYLILAEETNTEAWLSLAPEHSFIIFQSDNGLTNFETTNGHLATDDWLLESGFINVSAIKNKIYLDTLGHDGVFSTLLADLAMGYVVKFGYDDFTRSMVDTLLDIYPQSIQGHILKADILTLNAQRAIKEAGNPPLEQLNHYPNAYQAYMNLKKQYVLIDSLGYRHMPKEDYAAWRASGNSSTTNQTKNE